MPDTWAAVRARGDRARRTAEENGIRRALARAGWNIRRAAIELDVDAETLGRYLARRHPDLCAERRRMAKRRR